MKTDSPTPHSRTPKTKPQALYLVLHPTKATWSGKGATKPENVLLLVLLLFLKKSLVRHGSREVSLLGLGGPPPPSSFVSCTSIKALFKLYIDLNAGPSTSMLMLTQQCAFTGRMRVICIITLYRKTIYYYRYEKKRKH